MQIFVCSFFKSSAAYFKQYIQYVEWHCNQFCINKLDLLFSTELIYLHFPTQIWNFLQELTQSEMTIKKNNKIGLIKVYLLQCPTYRICKIVEVFLNTGFNFNQIYVST